MKNNKKVLLLAGAAALVLILPGILWALRPEPAAGTAEEPRTVCILTIGETPEGALERVSAALSEITLERLGCKVELKMIRPEEYDDRIDDLLLESDLADIFVCRNRTTMNKLLDGNYIYRLDRYLSNYPEFRRAVPEESAWKAVEKLGYTYGIPFGNDGGLAWGFLMRKDICDELEIDASSITTVEQLYQTLLRVRAAYPDVIPVVPDYGRMEVFASGDLLTGGGGCLATESGVVSVCELPEFARRCAIMRQWYQEGLILHDAPVDRNGRDMWMASGMAFGSFAQMGRYTARELEYSIGAPVECAILEGTCFGSGDADMSFVVYAYTKDVDLSLQVLGLIYSDPDVLRLCVYGEEHIDYLRSDSGAVIPAGETGGEERYVSWCWPLRDGILPPASPEDPAWYTDAHGREEDGFLFDNSAVSNEIYQCGEVLKKYFEALCAGVIDPEEGIPMMEDELADARMETVRAELEQQWRGWIAAGEDGA